MEVASSRHYFQATGAGGAFQVSRYSNGYGYADYVTNWSPGVSAFPRYILGTDEPNTHVVIGTRGAGYLLFSNMDKAQWGIDLNGHFFNPSKGAYCDGYTWSDWSDKNAKENLVEVRAGDILARIERLKIHRWNYKGQDSKIRHIGPMAQDFADIFGVGAKRTALSALDTSGVALAGIKALSRQNKALKTEVAELKTLVADLAARLAKLEGKKK